jgi:hypothetical protein
LKIFFASVEEPASGKVPGLARMIAIDRQVPGGFARQQRTRRALAVTKQMWRIRNLQWIPVLPSAMAFAFSG